MKLALSDHRAPNVTTAELIRLGSDARTAGMLSGKCGIVVLHMGDAPSGLAPVREALAQTAIPAKFFIRPMSTEDRNSWRRDLHLPARAALSI